MTEQEWLACGDPDPMIAFIKHGDRKLRLFAAGCCRRFIKLLTEEEARNAIRVAEQFADGLVDEAALREAISESSRITIKVHGTAFCAYGAVNNLGSSDADFAARLASSFTSQIPKDAWVRSERDATERRIQASLFRHIFGNPFRPYPAPETWPATVTQLANALYNGEDCGFALHDALLEGGHPELAEHFRQEQRHPKGCWVVDLVLGRA